MINTIRKAFFNSTRSLEILYLLEGIKNAVRLDANENEIAAIGEFCKNNGIFMEMSDFKISKKTDEGKGEYSNIARRIPTDYPGHGLYHIYLSKDSGRAKLLKILENKNDDRAVGEILGYPKCCIDFFMENQEKQQKMQNDFILPALENSEGFEFPFYTNHAIRYFDITLLSHFPHDFNCMESISIAKKNLEAIRKHYPELADKFESMLKSAVLYTEKEGIFIFLGHKFKDGKLSYGDVISTANNELLAKLKENNRIEIINKSKIKVNETVLEDAGFMIFT